MLGFRKGGQDKESGCEAADVEISINRCFEYDYAKVCEGWPEQEILAQSS